MRRLLIALCMGVVILPLSIAAQDQEQIAKYGYSYFTPPEDVGTVTTVVGMLEPLVGFTYPFTVDFSAYEYTFYFETMIVAVIPGPFSIDIFYADTEIYIYEDPAKNADHGANPPNGTSPSTFQDGTLALQGTLASIIRSDDPMGFLDPTLIANCLFTGGTKLPELVQGPNWTTHGGLILNDFTTPPGYQRAWLSRPSLRVPYRSRIRRGGDQGAIRKRIGDGVERPVPRDRRGFMSNKPPWTLRW